jgi:urease accessory protein
MRGDRPFLFTCLKDNRGVAEIARFVLQSGGLAEDRPSASD